MPAQLGELVGIREAPGQIKKIGRHAHVDVHVTLLPHFSFSQYSIDHL